VLLPSSIFRVFFPFHPVVGQPLSLENCEESIEAGGRFYLPLLLTPSFFPWSRTFLPPFPLVNGTSSFLFLSELATSKMQFFGGAANFSPLFLYLQINLSVISPSFFQAWELSLCTMRDKGRRSCRFFFSASRPPSSPLFSQDPPPPLSSPTFSCSL